jgi:NAD(P)-dependent dehydrogenase (short-subunit alcohol dehydrogenase family)
MSAASLQDCVALITGAAKGLGQVLALKLAERGISVALLDLNQVGLAETAHQVRGCGVPCCEIVADLTSPREAGEAVRRTVTELGGLDVLVNNAGTASVQPLLEITLQEWDRVFAVNVGGTLAMLQAAAQFMRPHGGGRIINITSPASRMALPNYAAYAASKAAVDSLTRAAAVALAPFNILVNSVAPGMMDTEMQRSTEALFATAEGRRDLENFMAERTQRVPLGRRADIAEVAQAIVWLALDAPAYITAERLNVSGGLDKD